ncbi:hypothetical protein IFJ82_09895 [Novacetimonas hansenii]|uniref:hypothetical protein n=1 Tax=Novacetimonas hansenii TaxID=436 RepID=UPI00177C6EA3|nr:hypothetical protein [Novacetimonas hansenii]QOF94263.1 hypothetical protein IFJ82_09895 [Novacetimonas hansenii]
MMIFTSDAAEPVEIPDARQPIWLLQATALAEREGAHGLNDPQTEALRLAWDQGESPQDAVTRVIGADYVQF